MKGLGDVAKAVVEWVEVGEDGVGQRLDNYLLKRLKGAPRA